MCKLSFTPGKGVFLNGVHLPHTNSHHWDALVRRVHGNGAIILTNEVVLNGNVEHAGAMVAFHIPRDTGAAIIRNGNVRQSVFSWRMLASLSELSGVAVKQGHPPTTLVKGDIVLLAYRSSEDADISFMISYAYDQEHAHV